MEVQAAVMKLGPGRGEPSPELQALGDLFLSAPARRSAPAALVAAERGGAERLVLPQAIVPEAERGKVPVLALLAAGLAPERRAALARAALGRLSAPQGTTLLVTFRGERACIQIAGDGAAVDDADPARKLDRLMATASRIVLVLADAAGCFLAAERQLPGHCIVLAAPAAESLVEAYRELKSAEAATGVVPDVFVVEAGSEAEAERAYRRLARVAIAHLGGSPTFAGRRLKRAADGGAWAAPQTVMDYVSAELVYERLRPVLETEGLRLKAEGLRNVEDSGQWSVGSGQLKATAETKEKAETTASLSNAGGLIRKNNSDGDSKRQTAFDSGGCQATALHENSSDSKAMFAAWTPGTGEELLAAVGEALEALLPGNRGLIELGGVVGAAERPALVAVDAAGRAVAVLSADDEAARPGESAANPAALRAALEANRWLGEHVRLLARAYPEAGLDAAGETAPPVVLVAEGRSGELELLCPAGVELAAWTGVAYGEKRGLMFRRVLGTAGLGPKEQKQRISNIEQGILNPEMREQTTNASPTAALRPRAVEQESSRAGETENSSTEIDAEFAELDGELSAGEVAELRSGLDLDQLT